MNKYLQKELKKIAKHIKDLGYVRSGNKFYTDDDEFKNVTEEVKCIIRCNIDLCTHNEPVNIVYPYINNITEAEAIRIINNDYISACDDFMSILEKNTKTKYKDRSWKDVNNAVKFLKSNKIFIKNDFLCELWSDDTTTKRVSDGELQIKLNNEFGKPDVYARERLQLIYEIIELCKSELPYAPDYINEYLDGRIFENQYRDNEK